MKKNFFDFKNHNKNLDFESKYLNNPVFIVGSGKSGTTLLQSLFDYHPNLLVFPVESMYYREYDKFNLNDINSRNKFKNYWVNESKFSWMSFQTYTKHSNEKSRDFSNIDFKIFKNQISKYDFVNHSRVFFYKNLLESFRISTNKNKNKLIGFVDKTPIHMFYINEILKDFPNAKIIHVLRNPYDNYLAYRKNALKTNNSYSNNELLNNYFFKYIVKSFEIANQNINNNYKIIRYEDLIYDLKSEMIKLSNWIKIPFSETMLSVTIGGKPWGGNSSSGKQFNGISKNQVGNGITSISAHEKKIIESELKKLENNFNYLDI